MCTYYFGVSRSHLTVAYQEGWGRVVGTLPRAPEHRYSPVTLVRDAQSWDVFRPREAFARKEITTVSQNNQKTNRCLRNARICHMSHRPWQHEYVGVGNYTQRITASSRTCSKDATSLNAHNWAHAKFHDEKKTPLKTPPTGCT